MRGWREQTRRRRAGTIIAASIQLGLAASAWADLARRSPDRVRGAKWRWAVLIGVNYLGPLAYFRWGRVTTSQSAPTDAASGPIGPARQ
jgi:hypothetical protein